MWFAGKSWRCNWRRWRVRGWNRWERAQNDEKDRWNDAVMYWWSPLLTNRDLFPCCADVLHSTSWWNQADIRQDELQRYFTQPATPLKSSGYFLEMINMQTLELKTAKTTKRMKQLPAVMLVCVFWMCWVDTNGFWRRTMSIYGWKK